MGGGSGFNCDEIVSMWTVSWFLYCTLPFSDLNRNAWISKGNRNKTSPSRTCTIWETAMKYRAGCSPALQDVHPELQTKKTAEMLTALQLGRPETQVHSTVWWIVWTWCYWCQCAVSVWTEGWLSRKAGISSIKGAVLPPDSQYVIAPSSLQQLKSQVAQFQGYFL